MRTTVVVLFVAFLAGGCVARLPVDGHAPLARANSSSWPQVMPVSEDRIAQAVERMDTSDACFVRCGIREGSERCGIEEGCEAGEEEEGFPRHEVTVFLGYTFERGDGGATVGVAYALWLHERLGLGIFGDYVFGDIDAFATGIGIFVHPFCGCPFEDFAFFAGPGVDIAQEKEHGEREWEVAPLLRLGALWAFDLGRGFRILPAFYWDWIAPDKQAYVIGFEFGKEF